MKKFIITIIAASAIATPVLAAPAHKSDSRGHYEQSRYEQSRFDGRNDRAAPVKKAVAQKWRKGDRFDQARAANYRVISNPRQHRLNEAPRGYRWVQSNNDAVLIAITSGIVASVMANALR